MLTSKDLCFSIFSVNVPSGAGQRLYLTDIKKNKKNKIIYIYIYLQSREPYKNQVLGIAFVLFFSLQTLCIFKLNSFGVISSRETEVLNKLQWVTSTICNVYWIRPPCCLHNSVELTFVDVSLSSFALNWIKWIVLLLKPRTFFLCYAGNIFCILLAPAGNDFKV